jgi:hypothetical protein
MDKKSSKRSQQKKTSSKSLRVPRGMKANEMIYSAGFSVGDIKSGTSGTISSVASPTINQVDEISSLVALFNEVRLLSFRIRWTNTQSIDSTVIHRRILFGTNMAMNGTTNTPPSSITDIINLPGQAAVATTALTSKVIRMGVPGNLEYLEITGDAPVIPAPFAGSPGVILIFAAGLTANTTYGQVEIYGSWHLRGRH